MFIFSWLCGNLKRRRRGTHRDSEMVANSGGEQQQFFTGCNLFISLGTLKAATDDFSDDNRLGQGGFGPVYKGVMPDGQVIAVKKLSFNSRQGLREFTNEVRLLLKVQHRNLVSLLGCCAEANEKMLVYEYLSNGSLDQALYDKKKNLQLDWAKRFEIITGIAKGLLYLHEESPIKIIHRDIKASNILLDQNLNPKISDFGMARLFQGDDTHVNTFKVSGTYGYMAPEYAINGYLSVKTDVFSFGVLVLEIVSGRKNLDRKLEESKIDLLSYAWNLSQSRKSLDLVDSSLSEFDSNEAAWCIQIGLLCVQGTFADRPDMRSVYLMLSSDSFVLPKPGKPGIRGRACSYTTTNATTTATSGATSSTAFTSSTTNAATTNASTLGEEYSRNSISVSFTTDGR